MAARASTVYVITCDAPDCDALAAPPVERTAMRPTEREGRYLLLAGRREAYAAARAAGWVMAKGPRGGREYCPGHAQLATAAPAPRVVDVHLPDPEEAQ